MATITLRATKGSPLTNNEVDANFNNLNTELGTKLASADFTGANILTKIKTVDGALSGLDADTLDGYNQDTANTNNTIVRRDGSGDFAANIITANDFQGQFSGTANITSGTITGITALGLAEGGTGGSTASAARTSMGLAIGSDVQAWSAVLDDIGGVTQAADKVPYFNSSSTASTFTVTSTARSLLDDTSASAMRSTLGLAIGSNVQGYDADLSAIGALSTTGIAVRTGNGTWATRSLVAGSGVSISNTDGVSGNITISTGQNTTTAGNVEFNSLGIGTAASGTTGEIRATNTITSYYSDERLKQNIELIPNALDKVDALRGITYNPNTLAESFGYDSTSNEVGVIAQDVQKVLPEAVKPAPFDRMIFEGTEISKSGEDYMTVQYERLVPLLVEAIKELNKQIKELKNENS
jgi:hypothetical protein